MDLIFIVLAIGIVGYIAIRRERSFFWGFLAALLFEAFHLPLVLLLLADARLDEVWPAIALLDIVILGSVVGVFRSFLRAGAMVRRPAPPPPGASAFTPSVLMAVGIALLCLLCFVVIVSVVYG